MKNKQRREAQLRGQIEIHKPAFEKFTKKNSRFNHYKQEYEYRNENAPVYIPVRRFRLEELKELVTIFSASDPCPRATIAQLEATIAVRENPMRGTISSLVVLQEAIVAYLQKNIVEGWVFRKREKDSVLEPFLVESVTYHPTEKTERNYVIPAHTTLRMIRWEKGEIDTETATWHSEELGKSVDLLMLDQGLIHEDEKRVKEYYAAEKIFLEWREAMGKQFLGNGRFTASNGRWETHDSSMNNTRLVVDDRCDAIERKRWTGLFQDIEADGDEAIDPEKAERYINVPIALHIWCFNLDSHNEGWVHIEHMKPYVYRPELREKLILDPSHQDLIDALTGDMDVLMEDMVSGKSGGTTILCQGRSGTGKTLTAEVYAEVVKRPLYRVHSGQLGIEAEGVEKVLKEALDRTKRWGAVMLIDEADVFLMQRGADLEQNAVCGVFLRILEYFDGLLFLTTNRLDAIDDAILSRCIAHIQFKEPNERERIKLWKTLGDVFGLKLTREKGMAEKLARAFPKTTGRDIKGLIRLAMKYSRQRKKLPGFDDVKRLAQFKVEVNDE